MTPSVTFPHYQAIRIHAHALHSLDTNAGFLCAPSDIPSGLIRQMLCGRWNILLLSDDGAQRKGHCIQRCSHFPWFCQSWVSKKAGHLDLLCSVGQRDVSFTQAWVLPVLHTCLFGDRGRVSETRQCLGTGDPTRNSVKEIKAVIRKLLHQYFDFK